jgi:hypothetical protein
MALGAATVVGRFSHDSRPAMMDIIQFAGDAAYPAGGTTNFRAFAQQAVARGHLDIIAVIPLNTGGRDLYYDRLTDKLQVLTAAGAEAAGDLSAQVFTVLVISC